MMSGWNLDDGDTLRITFTRGGKVVDVVDMTANMNTNTIDVSRHDEPAD